MEIVSFKWLRWKDCGTSVDLVAFFYPLLRCLAPRNHFHHHNPGEKGGGVKQEHLNPNCNKRLVAKRWRGARGNYRGGRVDETRRSSIANPMPGAIPVQPGASPLRRFSDQLVMQILRLT